eukprot:jgi/Mesen1/572/ME000107S10807
MQTAVRSEISPDADLPPAATPACCTDARVPLSLAGLTLAALLSSAQPVLAEQVASSHLLQPDNGHVSNASYFDVSIGQDNQSLVAADAYTPPGSAPLPVGSLVNLPEKSGQGPPARALFSIAADAGGRACEEPYGIVPCSTSVGGNVFLMLAFGYILLQAAQLISGGSELLLEVLNPGLIGGLLLPILGAFPDALLISVSGLRGTAAEAQDEVLVGMGVLAGSTVLLLSLAIAGSIYVGRCDLSGPGGTAQDRTLTRGTDLAGTGITTDEQTRWGAWVMALSTIPFLIVQTPLLDGHPAQGPEAALVGCIVAGAGVVAYCAYQVASPWLQQKRIEEARLQYFRTRALQGISRLSLTPSQESSGTVAGGGGGDEHVLRDLFRRFDADSDGRMSTGELRSLIIALGTSQEGAVPEEEEVQTWLKEFDINSDSCLSPDEFVSGVAKWQAKMGRSMKSKKSEKLVGSLQKDDPDFWAAQSEEAKKVLSLLAEEDTQEGEEEEGEEGAKVMTPSEIYRKAAILTFSGAALVAVFADPMVDAIGGFSAATGIPPFFVAFVVTPLASNASELVSSILFARKKRKRNISLTMSQIYGGVTMNNTLCLGIFLGLVYARGLTWDFSSEVTAILFATFAIGALGGSRVTFPLWMAGPIVALYPLSLGGVFLLDKFLGWS